MRAHTANAAEPASCALEALSCPGREPYIGMESTLCRPTTNCFARAVLRRSTRGLCVQGSGKVGHEAACVVSLGMDVHS